MNYLEEAGKWMGLPEDDIIEEDATAVAGLVLLTAIFGSEVAKKIKKIRTGKKYSYTITDKRIKNAPNYGYDNIKVSLVRYAYYSLGITSGEKNTLLYNSKSILNKYVYLYKFNSDNLVLVQEGTFEDLCKKYNLKLKPMNESKLKDRDKVYKQTVSLVKQELNDYKELKSKLRFDNDKSMYYDFTNGLTDTIDIFYGDLWDIIPNARSDEGQELADKLVYKPLNEIIKNVNSKLPEDYKLTSYGDWDDIDLELRYTGRLDESYIEEGFFKKKQKVILSMQDRKNIVKKVTTFLKQNIKKYDKRLNISYDGYESDPKSSHEYMTNDFIQGHENGYTILYTDFEYNTNKDLAGKLDEIIEDITSYMNDNRIRFEDGGHYGQYYINLFMNNYINESYIEEGLFNKNPYKDIIDKYQKESINYDYKKSYKEIQSKVISEFNRYLKSIKGIKIEGDTCNERMSGSIHIFTDRKCKASEQVKIDKMLKQYKFIKSYNPNINRTPVEDRHIVLIDDSIISVYFKDSWDLGLQERPYSNHVNFKVIYSKAEAKELGIPANVVYDIISRFKFKDDSVNTTPAFVHIYGEGSKKKERDKILNSLNYKTYVNGFGRMYIFNSKIVKDINESYIPERGESKMKNINNLVSLAIDNGLEPTRNRLRDDIVSEFTEVIDSLPAIEKSVVAKNIEMLPVYKINEYEEIEDDIIEESEVINESLSGDYEGIMGYNVGFMQRKVLPLGLLRRNKASLEKKLTKYEKDLKDFKKMSAEEQKKFCFKINAANAARSAAIAVGTTAASSYASDGNYSLTYIEIPSKITPFNYPGIVEKMIKKMKFDINKLDTIIKQREKSKGIKEGYAIHLDTLKYVVESKECTLEEAVQEIRDVNYIGDTYPMYCVLPENINENISIESFITLNESLNSSGIIPVAIEELSYKNWKEVGKEYKYDDRFRFKQTLGNITDIIKNMAVNPQKTGNFEKIRPRLLNMVDRCKTLEDVNYLKRDLNAGKVQLTKLKQNKPEISKQIDSHIKWLETEYKDALNEKAKELKSKK